MMGVVIEVDGFVLRPLCLDEDLGSYLHWMQSPQRFPYIQSARKTYSLGDLTEYIRETNSSKNTLQYGIFARESREHIGNIKFHDIHFKNRSSFVGFLIGQLEWQNRGVSGIVFDASSKILMKEFGISLYLLGVDPSNAQGVRAYRKMGFIDSTTYQGVKEKRPMMLMANLIVS